MTMTMTMTDQEKIQGMISDSCTLANAARENISARAQALRDRDYDRVSSLTLAAKEEAWDALVMAMQAKNLAEDAGDETQRTRAQGALDRAGLLWEVAVRRVRIL